MKSLTFMTLILMSCAVAAADQVVALNTSMTASAGAMLNGVDTIQDTTVRAGNASMETIPASHCICVYIGGGQRICFPISCMGNNSSTIASE